MHTPASSTVDSLETAVIEGNWCACSASRQRMGLLEPDGRHRRAMAALGRSDPVKTLDYLPDDLTGNKVLVRVDLNVPMEGAR